MLSFEGGTLLVREIVTMLRSKDVIQRTNFILKYNTRSCVSNYSCTKEKEITFWLNLIYL